MERRAYIPRLEVRCDVPALPRVLQDGEHRQEQLHGLRRGTEGDAVDERQRVGALPGAEARLEAHHLRLQQRDDVAEDHLRVQKGRGERRGGERCAERRRARADTAVLLGGWVEKNNGESARLTRASKPRSSRVSIIVGKSCVMLIAIPAPAPSS